MPKMVKNRPRRSSPLNLAGAFELFGQSYQIIRRNFEVFMVLFSVGALVALWDALGRYVDNEPARDWKSFLANRSLGSGNVDTGVFASGGFMVFITVLFVLTYLLLTIAVLRAAQGHKLTLGGLWDELVDRWLWLKLIGTFIAIAALLFIGFVLLVIPFIILLWRLFFVPFILIDQKTTIEDAFRRSWRMTRGYAGAIYGVILISILFTLTSIVPVFGPLVAFVLGSIYSAAPALRYTEIKKLSS